jgi:hypothetical protein
VHLTISRHVAISLDVLDRVLADLAVGLEVLVQ